VELQLRSIEGLLDGDESSTMTPADDRLEWEAVIGYNLLHLQCICSKDLKPEPTRGVTGTDLFHFRYVIYEMNF
jgi:hypothetical protein